MCSSVIQSATFLEHYDRKNIILYFVQKFICTIFSGVNLYHWIKIQYKIMLFHLFKEKVLLSKIRIDNFFRACQRDIPVIHSDNKSNPSNSKRGEMLRLFFLFLVALSTADLSSDFVTLDQQCGICEWLTGQINGNNKDVTFDLLNITCEQLAEDKRPFVSVISRLKVL